MIHIKKQFDHKVLIYLFVKKNYKMKIKSNRYTIYKVFFKSLLLQFLLVSKKKFTAFENTFIILNKNPKTKNV